jgi:hypothetical protein
MKRRLGVVLAAFIVATNACGPAAGSGTLVTAAPIPSAGSPVSGSGRATSSPGVVADGPATPGPFGRHDTPPGGVAEFLEFGAGGGGFCPIFEFAPPWVQLAELPLPIAVCAGGFPIGATVDLLLRTPDGQESRNRQVVDEIGVAEWDLTDLPDPIQGEYLVRATSQEISVEGSSRVESERLDGLILPDSIRIGETARLFLAGGIPNASLPAYLYAASEQTESGLEGPKLRFTADIGPLQLNGNGEGRVALSPRPGDSDGFYTVVVNPPPVGSPTADPGLFVLPDGSVGEFVDLAGSFGLTCNEEVAQDCVGDISGVKVTMSLFAEDSGVLVDASAYADGASHDVLGLYAQMARIATGMDAAEAWVRSATRSDERRFGDAIVRLELDPNAIWRINIDPFLGSPSDEVSAMLEVVP